MEVVSTVPSFRQALRLVTEIAKGWKVLGTEGYSSVVYTDGEYEIRIVKKSDRQWQIVKTKV